MSTSTGKRRPRKSPASGQSLDSNQLLSLCHKIRQSMDNLERSIQMVQLRLITLSYIHEDIEGASLKCFDNLIELCNLSQFVVQLLDELHVKLAESQTNSIHYQIASQQLMFFASEWYDNFTPKLDETFALANRQDLQDEQQASVGASKPSSISQSSDIRVRDALLRLKQSMGENERLIAVITANIEYTRTTIEAIQDSLESTKLGLDAGENNALEAIRGIRQTNRCKLFCYTILPFSLLLLMIYYLLRFLLII